LYARKHCAVKCSVKITIRVYVPLLEFPLYGVGS
jgi:hypothetical protein